MYVVTFSSMQEESNKPETVSLLTASNSQRFCLGSGYQLLKQAVLQLLFFSILALKFHSFSLSSMCIHALPIFSVPIAVASPEWLKCLYGLDSSLLSFYRRV